MTEAKHYDEGKPRMELLPPDVLVLIARGFTYGAKKYDDWNWTKGMAWGKLYASTQRHLTAWWGGEDIDAESGLPHLALAGCDLMMLAGLVLRGRGKDDRHKIEPKAPEGVDAFVLEALAGTPAFIDEQRAQQAPRTLPSSK